MKKQDKLDEKRAIITDFVKNELNKECRLFNEATKVEKTAEEKEADEKAAEENEGVTDQTSLRMLVTDPITTPNGSITTPNNPITTPDDPITAPTVNTDNETA